MADAVKAGRQDMDQEPADELTCGQAHDLHPVSPLDAVVLPTERHSIRVCADQAVVRYRDAMGVSAQVWAVSVEKKESPDVFARAIKDHGVS